MRTQFYEDECLPRVRAIARELNFLCDNSVDKDDIETEIEDITTEWQDALYEAIEDTDEDIDAYGLEGEDLLTEMAKRGISLEESDIEYYNDLCETLKELERIGASSLYEYFDDCLDIEYTIDSRGNYLGTCVWVGIGGPNIWIDTRDRVVKLAWGSERAECGIASDAAEAIDEIFEEMYNCINMRR